MLLLSYKTVAKGHASYYGDGIKSGLPIAIGYMPIALTFGLLAKTYNLTFFDAISMSVFVFAGAAQFMALQMLAMGTGAIEIVIATFIVNIRHFLMSASISDRAEQEHPLKKALYAFGITDETFSVASLYRGPMTSTYMFGLITMAYGSWVLFTGMGYSIGASLPKVLQQSMSIALYAMFIGLAVPSIKRYRKPLFLFITAAVLNSVFNLFLESGWAIVTATITAAVGVESVMKEEKQNA